MPLTDLVPAAFGLLLHVPDRANIPTPLRPGDFNLDAFPDLLLVVANSTAHDGGLLAGSRGTQAKILENVPCSRGLAGCSGNAERTFKLGGGKGWEVFDQIWDTTGASWIDIDEDVGHLCRPALLTLRGAWISCFNVGARKRNTKSPLSATIYITMPSSSRLTVSDILKYC